MLSLKAHHLPFAVQAITVSSHSFSTNSFIYFYNYRCCFSWKIEDVNSWRQLIITCSKRLSFEVLHARYSNYYRLITFSFLTYCELLFLLFCFILNIAGAQYGQVLIDLNVIRRNNTYPPWVTLSEKYPSGNYFREIRKEAPRNERILSLRRARLVTNNKNTVIR